jgi:ketosteroid isomerase-like protein
MKLRLLMACALLIAFAGAARAQDKNTIKLQDLIQKMVDAQIAFDLPALQSLTTTDYIEISPLGEFDPREKMLGYYKPELKQKDMEIKGGIDEFSVRDYGKFAVVISRLNYVMTSAGKSAPPFAMRATYVCRKEAGKWKIASAQFTSIKQK